MGVEPSVLIAPQTPPAAAGGRLVVTHAPKVSAQTQDKLRVRHSPAKQEKS
jgi:hypothetical protein